VLYILKDLANTIYVLIDDTTAFSSKVLFCFNNFFPEARHENMAKSFNGLTNLFPGIFVLLYSGTFHFIKLCFLSETFFFLRCSPEQNVKKGRVVTSHSGARMSPWNASYMEDPWFSDRPREHLFGLSFL